MVPLIPLFWTYGDVSSGFRSQSGQRYSRCWLQISQKVSKPQERTASQEEGSNGNYRELRPSLISLPEKSTRVTKTLFWQIYKMYKTMYNI